MRPAAGEALPPPQDDAQATLLLSAGGPERALARPWARWAAALCAAAAAAPAAAAAARCLRGGAPEGVVLAAAAALAAATTTTQPFARGDYQAAIDFLPVTTLVYYRWTHSKEEPTRKLPALIRKFDMLFGMDELVDGWDPLPAPPKDVRTILCIPWAPGRLLEWVKVHLDDSDNNRTVVFSGRESPLSEAWGWQDSNRWNEMTEQYSKYFKRIYFYVTDVELEGVDTMPIGFTESYMQGRTDSFLDAWTQASTKDTRKVHSVLAAWGKYTALGGKHLQLPA
ncbi:unnamed protein product [Prorocentrum cordatum]|uniref:Uncharacterized protein n=1 Tax=Prorocentrum cordatum TaxID=2364126 RepID=A0ABN9YEL4_9DINO|nr:unnamed protein product [Polarella glacialis]